jgi:nicotinamidase-related amidase
MTNQTKRDPATDHLLTPENAALILIDFQPSLIDGTKSIDRRVLLNNVAALTKAATMFDLPIVLSTIGVGAGYQGDTVEELRKLLPDVIAIDRKAVNAWEEEAFRSAVEATGRRKLIIAALWTEVCLVFPALDLLMDGYEVYAVSDASGGTSVDAHERAMQRMVQAGAAPVTWEAVMAELARLYKGDFVGRFVQIMNEHLPGSA